jgi:hypothetical protein
MRSVHSSCLIVGRGSECARPHRVDIARKTSEVPRRTGVQSMSMDDSEMLAFDPLVP